MADWTRGMTRTYEYWEVNPETWGDVTLLDTITGCSIERDSDDETLGSARFDMDSWDSDAVERYIRVYLVTLQDNLRERWPLGTFLVQAPDTDFDGMRGYTTAIGYTPLKELADDGPSLAYPLGDGDAARKAAQIVSRHCRAPVTMPAAGEQIVDEYVASEDDSWLTLVAWLLSKGNARLDIDGRGAITFRPKQDARSLMPVRVFDDSGQSIMQAQARTTTDAPEAPNVVEVVYSKDAGYLMSVLVNDDKTDANSTVRTGRRKRLRVTTPELPENPNQDDVDEYARKLYRDKTASTCEAEITHGYVPDVVLGSAIRLDYRAMGLNVVGVVVRQSIACTPSCQVTTTIRYSGVK